jgi:hypothetical protein
MQKRFFLKVGVEVESLLVVLIFFQCFKSDGHIVVNFTVLPLESKEQEVEWDLEFIWILWRRIQMPPPIRN